MQGHLGRLSSTADVPGAEVPHGNVVADLGDLHAVAEGLPQEMPEIDPRMPEAHPKAADLARKEQVTI